MKKKKIEIHIPSYSGIVSAIRNWMADHVISRWTDFKINRDALKKNHLNNIFDSWLKEVDRLGYDQFVPSLSNFHVVPLIRGLHDIVFTKNPNIVVGCVQTGWFGKHNVSIYTDGLSKTVLHRLDIDLDDGILTLKNGMHVIVTARFKAYSYDSREKRLKLYTSAGEYEFSITRFDAVMQHILLFLKSELANIK